MHHQFSFGFATVAWLSIDRVSVALTRNVIFNGQLLAFIRISGLALRAGREAAHQNDAILPR